MNADVIAQAKEKARDYFKTKGTLVAASAIHERIGDAFGALETFAGADLRRHGRPRGHSG